MGIYFQFEYGKLYEDIHNGVCKIFKYESEYGEIHHMFIQRRIEIKINNENYYDLITPYGYGGPCVINYKKDSKTTLLKEFEKEFSKYCHNNNIVSEFVRFHPIKKNAKDFDGMYTIENIRKTVGTNISGYDDPFMSEFSKGARKTIRKALRNGVSYRITLSPDDVTGFQEIYYSTMDRNQATDFYYFNDSYFQRCLKNLKDNIMLVEIFLKNKVIAVGFYFIFDNVIHAHLSGSLKEFSRYSPAYIMKYATVVWAQENGIDYIHYGGGTTNEDNDSLYLFKKKFGLNTEFDFSIARKIWNQEIYNQLCDALGLEEEPEFFPAYRYQN